MSDFLSSLSITNDQVNGPYFGILYGAPGTGKTWLCRWAEKPFYLAVEKGVEKVPDVGRFTKNDQIVLPETIDQFFDMLRYFLTQEHNYKTIVVDSGKFVDSLIVADIIKNNPTEIVHKEPKKVESIADYNFGTGYAKAITYWQRFLKGVDVLHKKGINVILIAHSHEKNTTNTNGDDYKKTKIDMLEFGGYSVPALLSARADWVYFIRSEVKTVSKKNAFGGSKTVGLNGGTPDIIVYTRAGNTFDAKVRTANIENIPDFYELDISDNSTSQQLFKDLLK